MSQAAARGHRYSSYSVAGAKGWMGYCGCDLPQIRGKCLTCLPGCGAKACFRNQPIGVSGWGGRSLGDL